MAQQKIHPIIWGLQIWILVMAEPYLIWELKRAKLACFLHSVLYVHTMDVVGTIQILLTAYWVFRHFAAFCLLYSKAVWIFGCCLCFGNGRRKWYCDGTTATYIIQIHILPHIKATVGKVKNTRKGNVGRYGLKFRMCYIRHVLHESWRFAL